MRVFPSHGRPPSLRLLGDRATLVDAAIDRLGWARRFTKEVNPAVLARFSVEVAYDDLYRMNVAAVLSAPWPTSWEWSVSDEGGPLRLTRSPFSTAFLPIKPQDFGNLDVATVDYAGTETPMHNMVTPFEGLHPTWPWAMDPIRPPVQAARVAAAVIHRALDINSLGLPDTLYWDMNKEVPPVLGIELGHSVGAEALALFLPEHKVYTHSKVFDSRSRQNIPDKFTAVVVNLPHVAALEFVKDILDRHEHNQPIMNRVENNRYWTWPSHDQGGYWVHLVQHGLEHLAPGGVLIVLADILSGQVHLAAKEIETHGEMERLPIWPGGPKAMSFENSKKPWAPFGCIRPTGRILRAWRRRP